MNTITFPKLNLSFTVDPILIHYKNGGGIHWYGIIIGAGVVLALLLCGKIYKDRGRNPEEPADFLLWALPIGIVGARAYYVIFSWDFYKENPSDIFKIWNGGLAIYGGIIGGLITAVIFCRLKRIEFFGFADVCVAGVIVGQCVGRWGNFVNGEAHGGPTDLPWGMSINGSDPVHPTFLYESLWSLLGLILILILLKKNLPRGSCFFTYLAWYGAGRFFIEGLRTDSLYTQSGLRVSQAVAAICVVLGIGGLIMVHFRNKTNDNIKTL